MQERFARKLGDFARVVDFVDESTIDEIEKSFYNYFREGPKVCYYEVCVPDEIMAEEKIQTLRTEWCFDLNVKGNNVTLMLDDEIRSHKAFCYIKKVPLWITPGDGESLLRECTEISDLRVDGTSADLDLSNLPKYRDYKEDNTGESRTSVCFPLFQNGDCIGLLLAEFPRVICYSPLLGEHFKALSESIGKLLTRYKISKSSARDTRSAYKDLVDSVHYEDCRLPNEKPVVFFSYPSKGDDQVVGAIKNLLSESYSEKLTLVDWSTLSESGAITPQIVEKIRNSQFGICYLSEPSKSNEVNYADNANVLFEAGMFHVLRSNRGESLRGWIPVRESEKLSTPTPFNFAADRLLIPIIKPPPMAVRIREVIP